MAKDKNKPLLRCLGEFVGHVVKGVKTPARRDETDRREVRREVEEERRPDGVVLRRTTIEEVELPSSKSTPNPNPKK